MYSREYVGVYQRENDEKNGRCFLDYNQEVNLVGKKEGRYSRNCVRRFYIRIYTNTKTLSSKLITCQDKGEEQERLGERLRGRVIKTCLQPDLAAR